MRGDKAVLFFFVAAAMLGVIFYESDFKTKAIAWLLLFVIALFSFWRRDLRNAEVEKDD